MERISTNREKWIIPVLLLGMTLLTTLPFVAGDGFRFADDWKFHFNRILGVAEGLRSGQFPVRVYPQVYFGAGYQAPLYYPDLFLYIPGILVLLGLPLVPAVFFFMFLINLSTAALGYFSMRKLEAKPFVSMLFSFAWLFCPYRLSDLYSRFALGETLALMFFPLLVAGFFEIAFSEKHRPYLLALGMSGIILSHVLSAILALLILVVLVAAFSDRLFSSGKRVLSLLLSAALSFGLTAFFLIPFLQADRVNTMVNSLSRNTWEAAVGPDQLLLPITLDNNQVFFLGYLVYPAIVISLILLFRKGRFDQRKRMVLVFLLFGVFFTILSTTVFPWEWLFMKQTPLNGLLSMIQFPWRFVGPASLFFFLAGGIALFEMKDAKRGRIIAGAAVLLLSMLSFFPYLSAFRSDHPVVLKTGELPDSVISTEYLYYNTDPAAMENAVLSSSSGEVTVRSYKKNGTNITADLSAPAGSWVDTDLFQFRGYTAKGSDGAPVEVTFGENNRLRLCFDRDFDGTVRVRYAGEPLWTVCTICSILVFTWVVWQTAVKPLLQKRKKPRQKEESELQ